MKKLKQNVSEDQRSNTQSLTLGREYSNLPVDLLIDIFLRVPSKTIAKLRCVSKLWSSIIRRQDFTELFLAKSLTLPRLLFACELGDKLFFSSSLQTPKWDKTSSPVIVDHQTYFPKKSSTSSIDYHHLNGLICRQEQKPRSAVICRPSTGESLTLPEVSTEGMDKRSYFIGYDPTQKQFKVLCMSWYICNVHNKPQEHRVMTLGNAEHLWRRTKFCRPHYPLDKTICINGVLYYLAKISMDSRMTMIVSFDVKSEIFSFIDLDEAMQISSYCCTFINYKGKLGLVHLTRWFRGDLEMLILEDVGEHIWSNHTYELSLLWNSINENTALPIVGITGTCDIVFSAYFLTDPLYVFYYNLDRKTLTRAEIRGFNKEFQNHRVYTFQDYVENPFY